MIASFGCRFRVGNNGYLTYLVKDILQLVLRQSRALHIFNCAQILGHTITVLLPNRLHLLASQLLLNTRVVAQIGLGADDQAGDTGAVVVDLGEPLFPHVLKGGRGGDGEADQEDISLGVGQWAQAIVILLTGGIEETESVGLIADPVVSQQSGHGQNAILFFVVLCCSLFPRGGKPGGNTTYITVTA